MFTGELEMAGIFVYSRSKPVFNTLKCIPCIALYYILLKYPDSFTHTNISTFCSFSVVSSRSNVIEKLEALELENAERMEVEEAVCSKARQGRSETRRFNRQVQNLLTSESFHTGHKLGVFYCQYSVHLHSDFVFHHIFVKQSVHKSLLFIPCRLWQVTFQSNVKCYSMTC